MQRLLSCPTVPVSRQLQWTIPSAVLSRLAPRLQKAMQVGILVQLYRDVVFLSAAVADVSYKSALGDQLDDLQLEAVQRDDTPTPTKEQQ